MADYKDIIAGTINSIVGKVKEVAESGAVRDIYENGANRAKSYGRIAKLALELNGENEELKRVYTEIGRLYYENYRDTADAFLADLCQQVTDANARVAELEAQMADPSLYSDAQKSADVQRAYQKAQQALQTLYEQWEAAEAALSQEEA